MLELDAPFGVYIHWPYCARICPYCDFNVYKQKDVDANRWARALKTDLAAAAARTQGRKLDSIYFGGGTPSLMPPELIADLIEACAGLWGFRDAPEITLEANPAAAETALYTTFAAAGVTRLSLGVQSFDDAALRFLGRDHSAEEARAAIEAANACFEETTFDLIYARPDQTLATWRTELSEALARAGNHISLYQLTIEPGTAFERAEARGAFALPQNETAAAFYEETEDVCTTAGFSAYEVSNHARKGAVARHNLLYWRYHDYVGVGPGAHGRMTVDGQKRATLAHLKPDAYLTAVEATGAGLCEDAALSAAERGVEFLSMGLRLKEGVDLARYEGVAGAALSENALTMAAENGLIRRQGDRIAATRRGRLLLNRLLLDLC